MIPKELQVILNFLNDSVPTEHLPKTEAIFIFGFIDRRIAEHAARLFHQNKAPKILISGGTGFLGRDPQGYPSEAECYAEILEESGVPVEALILEKKASNTLENVILGMKTAYQHDFYPSSIIVVALPPLLRRARATFAKHCPEIKTFGSSFNVPENEWRDVRRIRRVLGEIDRLKQYAEKKDIIGIKIPPEIKSAYRKVSASLQTFSRYK